MIDASKLLDLLLNGAGTAGPAGEASQPAPRQAPGAQTSGSGSAASSDLIEQAKTFLGSRGGTFAGGAAAGTLATLLLGSKDGRELAGDVLKLGAAAALGGLAYQAYANYREGKPLIGTRAADYIKAAQSGATLPGAPPPNEHALLLLRAMIAAALSDGLIDDTERALIVGRFADAGISGEERQFLDREIAQPWSPQQLANAAASPEMRSELYLASAIAIEADTAAEQAYLRYLAATLGLDDGLVAHLDAAVKSAKAPQSSVPQVRAVGT